MKRDKILDRLVSEMEQSIEQEKARVVEQERFFHRTTGARMTLEALLRAGAIHPDVEWFLRDWMKAGGYTALEIHGENIIPGKLQ